MTATLRTEAERLEALDQCEVLDTPPEAEFDEVTALAAELIGTPISLVSLLDESRQWFKSRHGLALDHTGRDIAFCAHAIQQPGLFEVPDAQIDPRFADNRLVTGEPGIRFYAGVPLVTADGLSLGTLNVIDVVPRRLSGRERRVLTVLARQVTAQLELRRRARALRRQLEASAAAEARLRQAYERLITELREAKRFSEQITQVMPSVLYVYDLHQRRCVFTNRAVEQALGHASSGAARDDDPVSRFMHPEDQQRMAAHMQRIGAIGNDETAEFTYRMRHADGGWRWFHGCDAVLERDAHGGVLSIVGTATDITALKEAELSLHDSEQRFRLMAESCGAGIATADADGAWTYLNREASAILGLAAAAGAGDCWLAALHPDDQERVQAGWRAAVAAGAAYRAEFSFQHADGTVVHVLAQSRPLAGLGMDRMAHVITLVDVTASRQVEQHRLARAAAEQANLAKSQFLARMSHEFRTPLNAILGFAQLMQIECASKPANPGGPCNPVNGGKSGERADQIMGAGSLLLALIDETLDLARIEAGVIDLHTRCQPLGPLVRACVEMVSESARLANVELRNGIDHAGGPTAWVDGMRFKEILINLLSNAIKYNRHGGHVDVAVRIEDGRVYLSVEDTGVGIPQDKLPLLFQPFNRLGAETSHVAGTGLGLAIAKRLAELMGGALHVQSVAGIGSVFTVEMRLDEDDDDKDARQAS